MSRRGWVVILLFVVFFKFGDTLAGAMTNPFLVKIGFTKLEIAEVAKVFGFSATIAGLFIGGALINGAGIIRSLWITGVLQLVSNLMNTTNSRITTQPRRVMNSTNGSSVPVPRCMCSAIDLPC